MRVTKGVGRGIHVDAEKEIVTTERIDRSKRGSRMQLVKGVEKGEGNRLFARRTRSTSCALRKSSSC